MTRRRAPFCTGRAVALTAVGLPVVLLAPAVETALWWLLAVVVLLVLDVALSPAPRRLALTRDPIRPARAGTPTSTTLRVRNDGRRRARALLRDAWQPSAGADGDRHRLRLPAGAEAAATTRLVPSRRGRLRPDRVTLRIFGPLGLAGRQGEADVPGDLAVLPPFESRRHLPDLSARLRDLDGRSATRVRGQGTEFDSLRDYVVGDDVRSIDWRATARRRSMVVRTWRPERDRHVVVVLDTSRTSAGRVGDEPRLDGGIETTLLLTALAERAGDRVDVVAGDAVVRARVAGAATGGGRAGRLRDVLEACAELTPALVEADWSRLVAAVTSLTRRRALLVLVTPLEPAPLVESLLPSLPALTRRHRVMIASVTDPELTAMTQRTGDVDEVYAAAAAEHAVAARARVAQVVGRLGVDVVQAPSQDLPRAVCDRYLTLKARGLL